MKHYNLVEFCRIWT